MQDVMKGVTQLSSVLDMGYSSNEKKKCWFYENYGSSDGCIFIVYDKCAC